MNQILLTENYKNTNNKNNKNNTYNIKKIIMFSSISILIFGIIIAGVYGYKIYSNGNKKGKTTEPPKVAFVEAEDNVKITAEAEAGINKIIYTWNDGEPDEVEMNGRTSHEEQIEIPEGQNKLNVKIIDNNGEEVETNKTFTKEENKAPVIEVENIEYDKLKIIATDENGIKYIAYRWNDEDNTIIEPEFETETVTETTIIRDGTNKITITAVDIDGNEEVFTKSYELKRRPSIEVMQEGNELYMKVFHEKGFEKVEFSINGKIYKYDKDYSGYDATKKELEYKFNMIEGENTVIILAVSTEGIEKTYKGKCQYSLEQQ